MSNDRRADEACVAGNGNQFVAFWYFHPWKWLEGFATFQGLRQLVWKFKGSLRVHLPCAGPMGKSFAAGDFKCTSFMFVPGFSLAKFAYIS